MHIAMSGKRADFFFSSALKLANTQESRTD